MCLKNITTQTIDDSQNDQPQQSCNFQNSDFVKKTNRFLTLPERFFQKKNREIKTCLREFWRGVHALLGPIFMLFPRSNALLVKNSHAIDRLKQWV